MKGEENLVKKPRINFKIKMWDSGMENDLQKKRRKA